MKKGRLIACAISVALSAVPAIGWAQGFDLFADRTSFDTPGVTGPALPEAPPPLRPTTNFYGMTGLIDMPSAAASPDGEFGIGLSYFGNSLRNTLTFQLAPRISGAFRYSALFDWNANGFRTYYDRSFDLKYQIAWEDGWRPALAIGLQDFGGTGIYAGEYVVATKTLAPGLTGTVGLGWGRLGSLGSLGSPFGVTRPVFVPGGTGGQFSANSWFRGPMAPFAGLEYRWDRWGIKAEYSSDNYTLEDRQRGMFQRKSPLNFGLEYQVNDSLRTGIYSMYGSEVGIHFALSLNPQRAAIPITAPAPGPLARRPSFEAFPEAWNTQWVRNPAARGAVIEALRPLMAEEGLRLIALNLQADQVEVRFENHRYTVVAQAIGRAARAMARVMPASVETFHMVLVDNELPVSRVSIRRSDLEALEGRPDRVNELWAVTQINTPDATAPSDLLTVEEGGPPRLAWRIAPYTSVSYFDPSSPVRLEVGIKAEARYRLAPGLILEGEIRDAFGGNLDNMRASGSLLPQVRTNGFLYNRVQSPVIRHLTLSYVTALDNNLFVRGTGGLLESMYGGVSGEVLWKPANSRLALGVEANYVRQRDFDQRFSFRNYSVATGHVSAYYQAPQGYDITVDAGRYLAGDIGATLRVERTFANGWRFGAFATKTNVSAQQFGEGSFDKGITLEIPLSWIIAGNTRAGLGTTIRPTQRDGGAKLTVRGRLFDRLRDTHASSLGDEWARVWR